ncbi:MAG TPA: M61 family peptidase, partial [Bacteroidetes bacterium]|nr:M61 family peptidase [Bacteroidota bacterium]
MKSATEFRKSGYLFILFCMIFFSVYSNAEAKVKNSDIQYTVTIADTNGHYLKVEMTVSRLKGKQVTVKMPVWVPGSYLVREFERHVMGFQATNAAGDALNWRKLNKNSWQIETKGAKTIRVNYLVYAFDTSVRASFVDADRAFINPSSVCMYVQEKKQLPHFIRFKIPANWHKISTGLTMIDADKHLYRSEDYDELVDCPVEIGNQQIVRFEIDKVHYEIAVSGTGNVAPDTLAPYFKKIVQTVISVMPGVPYQRYVFHLQILSRGGGGIEHRNSCILQTDRWSFQPYSRFKRFLGLVSHEFFHAWNVKSIRPEPLGPTFDYDEENYSTLLWIAEGFTTYYGSKLLLKAGYTKPKSYLSSIKNGIAKLMASPGRKWQSLSESSFDAWIKHYRPNENSGNSTISYYSKGALIGMMLDLLIRHESENRYCLDDVMGKLYTEYYVKKNRAYSYEEFRKICAGFAGKSLHSFFANYVDGTKEIDFNQFLQYAGLKFSVEPDSVDSYNFGLSQRSENG